MNARSTIVGVFSDRGQAEQAIDMLHNAGFTGDQITYSGHASEGGFLATIKSLFTGQDTSASAVTNDLVNMGVPDQEAQYYANEYEAGRSIVAVRPDGRDAEASNVLRSAGAYDYGMRAGRGQTTDYATTGTRATNYDTTTDTNENQALRLREEQLNVDKQRVQTGEVQLRKDVVTEQRTVDVPVTHEEVYIERRAASGQVDDGTSIGEGEVIRVPVTEEQVNVTKTPVVTGEVSLGKRSVQETQNVSDTVRREEARLDRQGNPNIQGDTDIMNDTSVRRTDMDVDNR